MKTTAFDLENAKIVEQAVCTEFGCSIYDIVSFKDTFFKKVVVFLLVKVYGYNKRNVGIKYQMSYLYVPTVVEHLEWQYRTVGAFEISIGNVCKKLGYEQNLDFGRTGNIKSKLSL
jgi:hypothetical protein